LAIEPELTALRSSYRRATLPPVEYEIGITDEAKNKLLSMLKEIRPAIGYKIFLLQKELSGDVQKL